ncbi:hypothetical protein COLO4_09166 [Corchorus olitorius]|uniref:F-box associated beta-propeller type 1 domain-containing protein n=1 Tax=Corchorus olitorius TaxID=93759 RepID=A0A1R3KD01_9ROSI|nr:hypothetical protein COLO4_09166 [Corchorus olitorius]
MSMNISSFPFRATSSEASPDVSELPVPLMVVRVPTPGVKISSMNCIHAFGFDSKTNDYKLLRFDDEVIDHHHTNPSKEPMLEVLIYSLNTNCWRSITHIAPKYILRLKYPRTYGNCFVNGAVHMLAAEKDINLILAFDVSEEVFSREIPLPECLSNGPIKLESTHLLKYGQSIAAMTWDWDWDRRDHYNKPVKQIHLWVMKEYGVAMSWTKVFTEVAKSVPRVLFFRQGEEEQVFVTLEGGWIASLDIKKKHSESLGVKSFEYITAYPVIDGFVESLVLLDNSNACWDVNVCDEIDDPQSVDGDSSDKGAPDQDNATSVDDDSDYSSYADDDSDENVAPHDDDHASSADDDSD